MHRRVRHRTTLYVREGGREGIKEGRKERSKEGRKGRKKGGMADEGRKFFVEIRK